MNFFFPGDIEEQVVNVILDLASPDSLDDYRTEAVAVSIFFFTFLVFFVCFFFSFFLGP